jgi:MraZ protein
MFIGQFTHTIDEKGRLTIPVRFRAALSSGAVILQGFDRNLLVYTTEGYQKLAQQAGRLSPTRQNARVVKRVIFGRAGDVQLDASGRVLIPDFLREYARLSGEATIVGTGEYFEIWNAEVWKEELDMVADPDSNAQRFEDFDLSVG